MAVSARRPVVIVEGAQWGSEAKGVTCARLCIDRDIDYTVRTGAINAGHTVYYGGKKFAMQQIPVGWVNPRTQLVIGAGAYLHPDTLWREIDEINAAMPTQDVRDRLWVDYRCGIHNEAAEQASKDANRHHRIGATGKGCSEAIVAKIRDRNNGYELFANTQQGRSWQNNNKGKFVDTVNILNKAIDNGKRLLIEGTQGTMLDLHIGPYPFTTSRMTSAANWIAECGLSPALEYEVVLVARTYPIRVAGNSGPMPNEIEWTELATRVNNKLSADGLPPKVQWSAISEFKSNLIIAARNAANEDRYKTVYNLGYNTELSSWTSVERSLFRVAASELHRDALNLCSPDSLAELKKLFEMTTVTKKLRRIATIDIPMLKYAVAINRPSWVCLTFLDYEIPQLAGMVSNSIAGVLPGSTLGDACRQATDYIRGLEGQIQVPIKMVGTGPETDHMFSASYLDTGSEK